MGSNWRESAVQQRRGDMQIKDRVFVVTGGASGLGAGAAEALAAQGATVVVADLQTDRGEAVATRIGGAFVRCDVVDDAQAQAAIARAQELGRLSGLVNCAGIGPAQRTVGSKGPHQIELFVKTVTVNLVGTFNMIRLAAAAMGANEPDPDTGERGVIVSTASIAAYDGQIGQAAYAASKGGIVSMTLPVARDLAKLGIRNMTIAPGIFATPMLFGLPEQVQAALAAGVPFPSRLGAPRDYARLVCHIVENDMLNGEVIRLDGALRMPPK